MLRRTCLVLLVSLWAQNVGCGPTAPPAGYADAPTAVCVLRDTRITEASGIVPSHVYPGLYYVHNDSGDRPQVFLIDRVGRTRLTIRLRGAAAVDYEDIALAPHEQTDSFDVCVADIGDNNARRSQLTIYRFSEPEAEQGDGAAIDIEPVAYRIRYANGPADAEALFVHPRTGDGYILTKRTDGRSDVYKMAAPWNADAETVLPKLLTLELPPAAALARVITAADVAPEARRVAVRTYLGIWEWRLPPDVGDGEFERIFQSVPVALPAPPEPQGEALCYAANGQSILTISEAPSPTLYELPAAAP